MSEKILNEIFFGKWKGKYTVDWCDLCDTAIIICPHCNNSSCNCGGCEICINDPDAKEFNECKTRVQDYMNEADRLAYERGLRIKKHILQTICKGEKSIDWEKLFQNGELNHYEALWFR